jgi:hypothetical protein
MRRLSHEAADEGGSVDEVSTDNLDRDFATHNGW